MTLNNLGGTEDIQNVSALEVLHSTNWHLLTYLLSLQRKTNT